jgi:natural product precursor
MKKIGKLKLNQLSKAELGKKELSYLRGGTYYGGGVCACICSCPCSGSSESSDESSSTSSGVTKGKA